MVFVQQRFSIKKQKGLVFILVFLAAFITPFLIDIFWRRDPGVWHLTYAITITILVILDRILKQSGDRKHASRKKHLEIISVPTSNYRTSMVVWRSSAQALAVQLIQAFY